MILVICCFSPMSSSIPMPKLFWNFCILLGDFGKGANVLQEKSCLLTASPNTLNSNCTKSTEFYGPRESFNLRTWSAERVAAVTLQTSVSILYFPSTSSPHGEITAIVSPHQEKGWF
jgi:hypothetical protein